MVPMYLSLTRRPFWVAVQAMTRSIIDRVGWACVNCGVLAWARAARSRPRAGGWSSTGRLWRWCSAPAVLDISCLDRVYLNGYVPGLMTGGQVGFLAHRQFPIPSTVALGKIGNTFRQAMARYAEANSIPLVRFAKSDRKIDVVRPFLEALNGMAGPGLAATGRIGPGPAGCG